MKRIVKPILLEVIVQTVDDARAAEAGGADRLEVVRDINRDGLTPSIDVLRSIRAATRLPLRVMVRESATFTVSDAPSSRCCIVARPNSRRLASMDSSSGSLVATTSTSRRPVPSWLAFQQWW
jgi:hypothetical protein